MVYEGGVWEGEECGLDPAIQISNVFLVIRNSECVDKVWSVEGM